MSNRLDTQAVASKSSGTEYEIFIHQPDECGHSDIADIADVMKHMGIFRGINM